MRVDRPLGAGHEPTVVEDPERTDAHLLGIAVAAKLKCQRASNQPPSSRQIVSDSRIVMFPFDVLMSSISPSFHSPQPNVKQ